MARPRRGHNGYILYRAKEKRHVHRMWVTEIQQSHQLQGSSSQSRFTRHFYPKSYAPGVVSIAGRCRTEREYQQLAKFIRRHQRELVTTNHSFARLANNTKGYQLLMKLAIPDEGISLRGWVPSFELSKRGVFNPAPEFRFNFAIAFDPHSTNIEISHALRKWYGSKGGNISNQSPLFSDTNSFSDLDALDNIEEQRLER